MNDGNIRFYLEREMSDLKYKIKRENDFLENHSQRIDDILKKIKNLRVHYTSLLNTAIAYGHEVDEDESDE